MFRAAIEIVKVLQGIISRMELSNEQEDEIMKTFASLYNDPNIIQSLDESQVGESQKQLEEQQAKSFSAFRELGGDEPKTTENLLREMGDSGTKQKQDSVQATVNSNTAVTDKMYVRE